MQNPSVSATVAEYDVVCNSACWKRIQVVQPYSSFDPVTWWRNGQQSDQFQAYAKGHLLTGVSVPLALLALVVVSLVFFIIWRALRCMGCCRNDHVRIHVHWQLTHPWMTAHKYLLTICAVGAIGLAIAGMIELPKQPLQPVSDQGDVLLAYGGTLLDAADQALGKVQGIGNATRLITAVLNVDVNATAINADLNALGPFLDALPDPGPMLTSLQATDVQVTQYLQPNLASLSSLLHQLTGQAMPDLQQISSLQQALNVTMLALGSFQAALSGLPSNSSDPRAGQAVASLQRNSSALNTALLSLQSKLQPTSAALDNIESLIQEQVLESLGASVSSLLNTTTATHTALQPLLTGLKAFISSKPVAAASTMSDLIARLQHLNDTVIVLDAPTNAAIALLEVAYSVIDGLYAINSTTTTSSTTGSTLSSISSSTLLTPDQWVSLLQKADNALTLNIDTGGLLESINSASARLESLPSLESVKGWLEAAPTPLQMLIAQVQGVNSAAAGYMKAPSAGGYSNVANKASTAQGSVSVASSQLTSLPASVQQWLSQAAAANDELQSRSGSIASQQGQISSAQQALQSYPFSITTYVTLLDSLASAYSALPTPHSKLVSAPGALLNRTVSQAQASIRSVNSQVNNAVSQVGSRIADARVNVLQMVQNKKSYYLGQADTYIKPGYAAAMAAYGLLIGLQLWLVLFAWLVCPFGLVSGMLLNFLFLAFWFIVSIALMGGMVVMQDGCRYAERIVIAQAQSSLIGSVLSNYYLLGGGSGSVQNALKLAGIADIAKIQSDISAAQVSMISGLQANFTLQPNLNNAVMTVSNAVDSAQQQITDALALADYQPVNGYYVAFKTAACCDGGAQVFVQWVLVTASGVLALLAVLFAKHVLTRVDDLPHDNCCGAQCYYRASKFRPPNREARRRFWGTSSSGTSSASTSSGGAPTTKPLLVPSRSAKYMRSSGGSASTSGGGSGSSEGGSSLLEMPAPPEIVIIGGRKVMVDAQGKVVGLEAVGGPRKLGEEKSDQKSGLSGSRLQLGPAGARSAELALMGREAVVSRSFDARVIATIAASRAGQVQQGGGPHDASLHGAQSSPSVVKGATGGTGMTTAAGGPPPSSALSAVAPAGPALLSPRLQAGFPAQLTASPSAPPAAIMSAPPPPSPSLLSPSGSQAQHHTLLINSSSAAAPEAPHHQHPAMSPTATGGVLRIIPPAPPANLVQPTPYNTLVGVPRPQFLGGGAAPAAAAADPDPPSPPPTVPQNAGSPAPPDTPSGVPASIQTAAVTLDGSPVIIAGAHVWGAGSGPATPTPAPTGGAVGVLGASSAPAQQHQRSSSRATIRMQVLDEATAAHFQRLVAQQQQQP